MREITLTDEYGYGEWRPCKHRWISYKPYVVRCLDCGEEWVSDMLEGYTSDTPSHTDSTELPS